MTVSGANLISLRTERNASTSRCMSALRSFKLCLVAAVSHVTLACCLTFSRVSQQPFSCNNNLFKTHTITTARPVARPAMYAMCGIWRGPTSHAAPSAAERRNNF